MCQVSVLVAVYNSAKYIRRCMDSLLAQTLKDIQIICVDDCSTDESLEILNKYADTDPRIDVISLKENRGQAHARNEGLSLAGGKYITFVDSDDWLEPQCIGECLNIINKNKLDFLQFSSKRVNDKGDILFLKTGETPILNASQYIEADQIYIAAGCLIYRTSIINATNLKFDEDLKLGEDQLFIYHYISKCQSCMRIKNTFYNYNTSVNFYRKIKS